MTDEKYVRSKCLVVECEKQFRGAWLTIRGVDGKAEYCQWDSSPSKAWQAAASWTRQREEEIRQVEEEIEYVRTFIKMPEGSVHPVWSRILAREQAVLAELQRGMKPAGGKDGN